MFREAGLDFEVDDCQDFLNAFFSAYPEFKEYHKWVGAKTKKAKESQKVYDLHGQYWEYKETSRMGRCRYWREGEIPLVKRKNYYGEEYTYTICNDVINYRVQTTAINGMKMAMVRADNFLAKRKSTSDLILQVHDELVYQSERKKTILWDDMRVVEYAMRDTMQKLIPEVPIIVESKFGSNWGEMEEVDLTSETFKLKLA